MCTDDFISISENINNWKAKFLNWKGAYKRKGLNVNPKKTKVMVSGLKGEILRSKFDPFAKCEKRVMTYSVMCTKCGECMVNAQK